MPSTRGFKRLAHSVPFDCFNPIGSEKNEPDDKLIGEVADDKRDENRWKDDIEKMRDQSGKKTREIFRRGTRKRRTSNEKKNKMIRYQYWSTRWWMKRRE
jgi:hypothetical protein